MDAIYESIETAYNSTKARQVHHIHGRHVTVLDKARLGQGVGLVG